MSYNPRWAVFEGFADSDEGRALSRRIDAMVMRHFRPHASKLDPNWQCLKIRFADFVDLQRRLPLEDTDACKVEFDYRPKWAILIGPKVGNMPLTTEVFGMVPEPLLALMRMSDALHRKPVSHLLWNPKHNIELIDGKTVVRFENCVQGVVRNVRGDEFDVEIFDGSFGSPPTDGEVEHYTRERLMAEIDMEVFQCQAVGIDYLPYTSENGTRLETAEEVRAANQRAEEAHAEVEGDQVSTA